MAGPEFLYVVVHVQLIVACLRASRSRIGRRPVPLKKVDRVEFCVLQGATVHQLAVLAPRRALLLLQRQVVADVHAEVGVKLALLAVRQQEQLTDGIQLLGGLEQDMRDACDRHAPNELLALRAPAVAYCLQCHGQLARGTVQSLQAL